MNSGAPVVIVGAGITGLSAAHRIVERARDGEPPPPLLVLESSDRIGGQIRTDRVGGFVLEGGPDTLVTQKPAGVRLCERLGLGPDLEDLASRHPGTEILWNRRLHRVPDGFAMMAPTRLAPVLASRLFSWRGKLRMAAERFVRARPEGVDDESLASFVTRRFGREALDRAAEPIAASLFTADARHLSLRVTMPRFLDLERRHGSVLRGLSVAAFQSHGASGARLGAFVALRGGFSRLVEALAARLPPSSVKTGARVASIDRSSMRGGWTVRLEEGEAIDAAAVILASPAFEAARVLRRHDEGLAKALDLLPYASCATVSLAYDKRALTRPLRSFGFFVPSVSGLPLLACSYVSEKFPSRVPSGTIVLRAFLGGATRPEILDASDDALARIAHEILREVLSIGGEPVAAYTYRYPRAMPQYGVGASAWLAEVARSASAHPGLAIAGSAAGAVGLPDAIRSGEEAADRIAEVSESPARVACQADQKA